MSERVQRVARYIVAGGSAAAVNFLLLYILTEYAHLWYLASSLISIVIGYLTSFLLQKFWTFQNPQLERVHIQAMLHALLSVANIILNTILLYLFVEYLHMWYIAAQFFISGGLAVANYFVYRLHIFPEIIDTTVPAHTVQK